MNIKKIHLKNTAMSKALESKEGKRFYTSPTGSKHRLGSAKHEYWKSITKRGSEDKKYGAGD